MLSQKTHMITSKDDVAQISKKIKGTVVLMKKYVLDLNDFGASINDTVSELLGQKVSIQLISSDNGDPTENNVKGRLGKPAYLENWINTSPKVVAGEGEYGVTFDWDEDIGFPGAFIIKNSHHSEFYLITLTLHDVPSHGRVHFICNSWIFPADKYKTDRVFFANQTFLPSETPVPLRLYREQELINLRGDGTRELQKWDRIYDYAVYNDLGDPDSNSELARPVLGGSQDYPYPRRGRTSRPPTKTDPNSESRLPPIASLDIYVPSDEQFRHLKMSDFLAYGFKSVVQVLAGLTKDGGRKEFETFGDVLKLYEGGVTLPDCPLLDQLKKNIPLEFLKELLRTDGEAYFSFPLPSIIQEDKDAWRTDEEFAREMLAGVNPGIIKLLQEFPVTSKLDPSVYGKQTSTITREQIEPQLGGLTIEEALGTNKLFILDYHDTLMPYLRRINSTSTKTYASRTLLFLQNDETLKPMAIELSSPHPDGDQFGAVSQVYTPAEQGVEGSLWQLAKAYVGVNDSGVHQLISHWLHTHAVIEPFVIATNRQLSVIHPIHKLLHPHFRDTMYINAMARQILINAGGILESTVFPSKYAMEMSSVLYKDWIFPEQALPIDLVKRGMAVEDSNAPYGIRLLIQDYPYAVDGLEIWTAIRTWVEDYCNFYYQTDDTIQNDPELHAWWTEVREKGHADKRNEPWWPKMQTRKDLIDSCTIIIWVASALHASTNFGQYPYAGFLPNRPTLSRRFMPEPGMPEYEELKTNPERVFLKTITAKREALIGISLIEILSRHTSDEVYLGQRGSPEWTKDVEPMEAFERFGKMLSEIEQHILQRNKDSTLKNRAGPVKLPYTLLYPSSELGLTGRGIPNSVAI